MESKENYLRAVYDLTDGGDDGTTTSKLADRLDVSDASASEAVQKLEEENLLCRAPYKGFTLSPMGKNQARNIARKYRALKDFFSETLGVENAEEQADAIEHHVTEETVEEMESLKD